MRYKVLFPLLASLMMIGAFVMTSCSSDDEEVTQPEQQAQDTKLNLCQQFDDAITTLNEKMSGLDFKSLTPLTNILKEKDGQEMDAQRQKFNAWLQQVLQKLNQDFSHKIPYGFTMGFESVENAFSMVWSTSSLDSFGREEGHGWTNQTDTIVFSTDYPTRDGSVYHVTLEERRERDAGNFTVTRGKERILTIVKGEEQLISIKTSKENERQFIGLIPSMGMDYTGEICYKDYLISLGYIRPELHERILQLSVNHEEDNLVRISTTVADNFTLLNILKKDVVMTANYNISLLSDQILVNGNVNSIGKLVAHAAVLLSLRKVGASEDICNELCQMFNENMTTNLTVMDNNVGKVIAATVFSDNLGKYVPSLLIISPLFGDEPVDINSILSNFGFSIDDIMEMIKGRNVEE